MFDNTIYNITEQDFDIAFQLQYKGPNPNVTAAIFTYLSLYMVQWNSQMNETSNLGNSTTDIIPLIPCPDGRFGPMSDTLKE